MSEMRNLIFLLIVLFTANQVFAIEGIVFIVNIQNDNTSVSSKDLLDFFLKRKRTWPDGSKVRFIDRKESPERRYFLSQIVKKSAEELDAYWIGQKLYSGDSAPVQSSSDSMSIQFVSTFKEAVGYISADTLIKNKNVKVIDLTDRKE